MDLGRNWKRFLIIILTEINARCAEVGISRHATENYWKESGSFTCESNFENVSQW